MFSGFQPIKFGVDWCPKKQNNATSNLEISFPHISIKITDKNRTRRQQVWALLSELGKNELEITIN
jgi:hypothetical protein